ncbi:MAG: anaerobic ribonucleoside-triphosphate reductase activating protein [Lachnospiraceae bacterium]|nr:anaerobic ribonucleoside-triphosphate reductase activating protein [Lachnospiraceae bacterium]
MLICGLQKTTLLDFPGHVACTIFTGGCNFRCPYCQNGELVLNPAAQPSLSVEEVMAFLKKRKGILEGVCITGGEPTLQSDLEDFVREVKNLGYLVKLDSNGYHPEALKRLVEQGLLDYVAMDVKASKANYARVTGVPNLDISRIEESVAFLMSQRQIPFEFRTTVVRGLHTLEEFEEIGKWLEGAPALFLQCYQESGNVLNPAVPMGAFEKTELDCMAERARKYIARVEVRGVE